MDRDSEIVQINRELEILRSRYAFYRRWARVLRVFFLIWTPLAAALFLLGVVKLFRFDLAMGLFFVGLAVIVSGLIWLWGPYPPVRQQARRGSGWIDLASPPLQPIAPLLSGMGSNFYFPQRSDADLIEEQIAVREQRLKELDVRS
jgi:hypothetical protein